MSKTKGNVIDPLDVVDQFGSDALRYSLVTGSTPGQDVPLSMERIEGNRYDIREDGRNGKVMVGRKLIRDRKEGKEKESDEKGRGRGEG